MKLWTVWTDHFATGEGRALMARIAHSENAQDALDGFSRAFDPYYAAGAVVVEGVVDNHVTQSLFAPRALANARALEGEAMLELFARFHFNMS